MHLKIWYKIFSLIFFLSIENGSLLSLRMHSSSSHDDCLLSFFDQIDEGFAVFGKDDRLIKYNHIFKKLYPDLLKSHGLITYRMFLENNLNKGLFNAIPKQKERLQAWLQHQSNWHEHPGVLIEKFPSNTWIEIDEYKVANKETVGIFKDITRQKTEEERLTQLALHDSLTGLPNRNSFENSLKVIYENAQIKSERFAVGYLDLDDFKKVNDTFGHEFGDSLLIEVGKRLQASIQNKGIAARLGGDEFAVILENNINLEDIKIMAKHMINIIGNSFTYKGQTATFGVSIGMAQYPQDGQTPTDLLNAADMAMYDAKKKGKGHFCLSTGCEF